MSELSVKFVEMMGFAPVHFSIILMMILIGFVNDAIVKNFS